MVYLQTSASKHDSLAFSKTSLKKRIIRTVFFKPHFVKEVNLYPIECVLIRYGFKNFIYISSISIYCIYCTNTDKSATGKPGEAVKIKE